MRRALPHLHPRPELDRLFDALADVDRLELLRRLNVAPSTAGVLAPELGWTRDEVSKQLNLLKRAVLVESGRLDRRVEYARVSSALSNARSWMSGLWIRVTPIPLKDVEVVSLERRVDLAGALRTAGRRNMLECMCRGGPITQGAAAADCGLTQGHASQGLEHLMEVGLVSVRSPGPPRRYVASPHGLGAAMRWIHEESSSAEDAQAQWRRMVEARNAYAAARRGM